MAELPPRETTTVSRLYDALEAGQESGFRRHLGASLLGGECRRALWFTFRWATRARHSGHTLRLFRRGQLEEAQLVADLRAAGIEVQDRDPETGRQFYFSDVGGHVGGSMDAQALGLEEAPKTLHVLEFKTHNLKSFRALQDKGVKAAKPEHWFQMQLYMKWSGLKRAAYIAVSKDNDDIYLERIHYDANAADVLVAKARLVVESPTPLERISEKPEFYLCKWCNHRGVCHEGALPEVTCRSCAHSTPALDGNARWVCEKYQVDIPPEMAERGCHQHVYIPALVPWTQVDANPVENWVEYRLPGGECLRNGSRESNAFESGELLAAHHAGDVRILLDGFVQEVREQLGGRVTG